MGEEVTVEEAKKCRLVAVCDGEPVEMLEMLGAEIEFFVDPAIGTEQAIGMYKPFEKRILFVDDQPSLFIVLHEVLEFICSTNAIAEMGHQTLSTIACGVAEFLARLGVRVDVVKSK